MKQKMVIKVSMNGTKSRSKALKITAGVLGVESVTLQGDDKDQIVVTGDGVDSICLTTLLRKKFVSVELVSVAPVEKEEKKKEEKKDEQSLPTVVWPAYQVGVPYHFYEGRGNFQDSSCAIL